MKKTFRFLSLGLMLLGGTLSSFAAVTRPALGPANDAKVGSTVSGGVVVYKVTGWDGTAKNAAGEEVGAYQVEITGLDYTGIQTKPTELNILTAFQEKYGEIMANYYVVKISDASIDNKVAFYAKTDLTSLTFTNDESVVAGQDFEIGKYAFYGCSKLATLTFPDNVKAIGEYAFQDCAIVDFEIPANCATIGQFAFYNCKKLNTVTVRNNVDKDGKDLGGKLTALNGKVFANSTLKTLDLSEAFKLTTVGAADASPFLYNLSEVNNQLQKVILPKVEGDAKQSLVTDVYKSFMNCTGLQTIENLDITKITAFDAKAFNNCQSLTRLDFPKGDVTASAGFLTVSPFVGCVKLETITFADDFQATIGDGSANLFGAAKADLAALKTILFGGTDGTGNNYGIIADKAFVGCTGLTTVDLATLSAYNNMATSPATQGATINAAFTDVKSLTTLTIDGVTIPNYVSGTTNKAADNVTIAANAFAGTGITAVNFNNISIANKANAATFSVAAGAFGIAAKPCAALTEVTFGNITISENFAHKVTVADGAFVGDAIATFTVGNIDSKSQTTGAVAFGSGSAAVVQGATKSALTDVTFGNITADHQIDIAASAFTSPVLANVTIGNLSRKTATVTTGALSIGNDAFKNSGSTATDMIVEIGDVNAKLTVGTSFIGSTAEGSSFSATLGDLGDKADINFAAGSFDAATAAAAGEAYFEIGDIDAATTFTSCPASTFKGAVDADSKPNTTVVIGAYGKSFPGWFTITNVKDLTIKSFDTAANFGVTRIAKPVILTITDGISTQIDGDAVDNTITTLTINGTVAKANSIQKFGNAVRTIDFGNDNKIAKNAVADAAFQAASTAAADKETITVTYNCTTEADYNPIFVYTAFGATAANGTTTFDNVKLYTTEWAKNNIFENTQVYDKGIYRMTLVASEIVPGVEIKATLAKALNGKQQYGRLYIPQGNGMYYKIDAKATATANGVNVFSGHLDGDKIYMKQLDTYEGYYWIDAVDANQVFVVRCSDLTATEVVAEQASDEEIADYKSGSSENVFWFAKADAKKNCLKYATAAVVNQELQNNAEFKNKTIYVMANPAKYNLAFAKKNQYTTTFAMPQGAIYVLSNTDPQAAAGRLQVIFDDEVDNQDNATAIESVKNAAAEDGAIYNLQGVRVSGNQKGVYIINGKKVIR